MTVALSPSNLYLLRSSRTSISTRSSISGSSTASHLFRNTTMWLQADLASEQHVLARLRHHAVERADTTRIAPSICAAPVIMFLM